MKPKTLKTALLLGAFAAMNFGFLFGAHAQIKEAQVKVDGLGCPFCVKGVEKHLKKVEGVQSVSTSLNKGEVVLRFAPGATFELSRIEKAVVRGGFTPGAVFLTAVGQVVSSDDDFVLNVTGAGNSFVLDGFASTSKSLSAETRTELGAAKKTKQTLQITGRVHSRKQGSPGLAVKKIAEVTAEGTDGEQDRKE